MSRDQSKTDITLSKTLSWLLRHAAQKEGLDISAEGYISVNDILKHHSLNSQYKFEDIERVVNNNDKKRFHLRKINNNWEIKANQGHSVADVANLELTPLLHPAEIPQCIHGTYYKNLPKIKKEGLNRMKRNHVHFASDLPTSGQVLSGARSNAQVFIYIDIPAAISAGLKFYKSSNGVILSAGNSEGIIEAKYFLKICDVHGNSI